MMFILVCLTVLVNVCSSYPLVELNPDIVPKRYEIELTVLSNNNASFSGVVSIYFILEKEPPDKFILLSSERQTIQTVYIKSENGMEESVGDFSSNENTRILKLPIKQKLIPFTEYQLKLSYIGTIFTDGYGLHSIVHDNTEYYMTNLYPFYGKRVFPCFENINKKAEFNLTIITDNVFVIANTEANSVTPFGSGIKYVYKQTPTIPIYSVFFLLSNKPFVNYGKLSWGDNSILLYPSFNKQMFFNEIVPILNSTLLEALWEKGGMSKLNLIVVPALASRTYSGYGVVVVRRDVLELDVTETTTQLRRNAALTVLEGIIKVYFGTITSPASWEENWLSDSISTYFRYKAFNSDGSWGNSDEFMITDIHMKALATTWQDTADPVVTIQKFNTTEDLTNFISGPSVTKGAAVLYMLETFSQVEDLQETLLDFYHRMKHQAGAKMTDLYMVFINHFKTLPFTIEDCLNNWLYGRGYPMLSIKRIDAQALVSQTKFSLTKNTPSDIGAWVVPISYETRFNPNFNPVNPGPTWLPVDTNSLPLDGTYTVVDWLAVNIAGKSPYATNYDDEGWKTLAMALTSNVNTLSSSTRAKLVRDAFTMAHSGKAKYSTVLYFLNYLEKEMSLAPWLAAIDGFKEMWTWIFHTNIQSSTIINLKQDFQNYVFSRMLPVFNKLGVDPQGVDHVNDELRREIVGALSYFGYKPCIDTLDELYKRMINPAEKYLPQNDMNYNLVCAGLRNLEDSKVWEDLYEKLYKNVKYQLSEDILNIHLQILACPHPMSDTNVPIKNFLNTILLTKNDFPSNKISYAYKVIHSRAEHINQALFYILDRQLGLKISIAKQVELLRGIGPHLSSDYHYQLLRKFLENHVHARKEIVMVVNELQKMIAAKIQYIKGNQKDIKKGLVSHGPVPPTTQPTQPTHQTTPPFLNITTTSSTTTRGDSTTPGGSSSLYASVKINLISFALILWILIS